MTATDPFDADRLDAWLEGNPFPSTSLNGHSDTQPDLVGTAKRFHADASSAERGLPVPTRAIWEDVMHRTAGLQISPPVIVTTAADDDRRLPPLSPGRLGPSAPPPQRGLWITTASLVVVAMFAIAAVVYLADRSNGSGETPGISMSALSENSVPTVTASPAADGEETIPFTILDPTKIDCSEITRRSNEEISALQADPGEFSDRSYGPAATVDPDEAGLVSVTDQYLNACRAEWRTLASPRLIAETRATGSPSGLFPSMYLDQGMALDDLPAFLQSLVAESGATEPGDLLLPVDAFGEDASWALVINPDHARLFPDGRIGAPQSWLVHSNQYEANIPAINTQFVFYIQDPTQDDKWVLDETLPICVGECDAYWEQMMDPTNWSDFNRPSLVATPAASPEADDSGQWLRHPDNIDCVRADPDPLADEPTVARRSMPLGDYLPFSNPSPDEQVVIATKAQQLIVGCDLGSEPLISEDFSYFDTPYGEAVTIQQLDTARALSETVQTDDLMDHIVVADEPRAINMDGDLYSFSRRTLLPESIVLLPDGRLGGPLTAVLPSTDSRDEIATYIAERGQIETNFVIFERQGDTWVLDESITLCLGECNDWWAMYRLSVESPTAATPAASPVADDESVWLADPQKVVCSREFGNWTGIRSSEIPGTINDYLFFEIAPNQAQLEVARTNQAVAGLCFDELDQEAYFADILWSFPLRTEGVPVTQAELDIARSISEVINSGDAMDFVHATEAPFELIQPVVSHSAILPSSVVKLPDGRYAAPLQFVFEANSPEELRLWIDEAGGIVVSRLVVFTAVADGYVLEGYLPICLGNCDGYWDSYEIAGATGTPSATIEASPEADDGITLDPEATYVDPGFWLLPEYPSTPERSEPEGRALLPAVPPSTATPEPSTDLVGSPAAEFEIQGWLNSVATFVCPTPGSDETQEPPLGGWPTDLVIAPEHYIPFGTPSVAERAGIEDILLVMSASCDSGVQRSPDFAWMPGPSVAVPSDEQIAAAQEISTALPDQDPDSYLIIAPSADLQPNQGTAVFFPGDLVRLADGRVGAPARWVVPSAEVAASMTDTMGDGSYTFSAFFTFEQAGDDWLLDEMFLVCIGDCDGWWEMMADPSLLPATPVAPGADVATPQPISAQECDVTGLASDEVSAIVANPGEEPERSYVPVGPAESVDAVLAVQADRAWAACSTYGSIGQRTVMQTPWLTATGPEADLLIGTSTIDETITRINQRQPLSDGMLSADQLDYYVSSGQTEEEMIGSLMGYSTTVPHPTTAVVLADGRIAIPQLIVMPSDSSMFTEDWEPYGPYYSIPVHILAKDSETQRWLVDEVIWLAGGDLDELILSLRDQEAAMLEQAGLNPATPEATPAGGS
jgi:hypothetical protein